MKVIPVGHFRIGLVHGHQFIPWGNLKVLFGYYPKFAMFLILIGNGIGRTANGRGCANLRAYARMLRL